MTKPESYKDLKSRQQEEINNFKGIFFAFSNSQFKEGMEMVGLDPDDTKAIYSLGAGGYIRKDRSKAWGEMLKRLDRERKEARKSEKHLLESLVCELKNHEYCFTHDEIDALEALGLDRSEIPANILKKAKALAA